MEESKDTHSTEEHQNKRAQLMKKFKISTKELVKTAADEVNEARSPGFDNETAAKVFL